MADLKTNYKDDVLDTSVNEKRKFNMIQNSDGTVSFEDVTEYTQTGDSFGAADINATNAAVNKANSNLGLVDEIYNSNNIESNLIGSDGSGIGNKITIPNASKYKAYAIVFYFGGYSGYTEFVIAPNEVNKIQRCSHIDFWTESNITKGQTSKAQLVYDNGNVTLEALEGARYSYNTYTSYSTYIVRAYGLY